jgi:opacity protein-like surface antigen
MLTSNLGYGADVRWNILWDRFSIGLSGEKISGMDTWSELYPQFGFLAVPHQEGFEVTAVELSGYYVVPISSENIRFYLGGGLGTYDGKRKYSIAGVNAETISSASYMGIHVMTGIDYRLNSRFGLRFEIKFRDPHFDVTTKFETSSVEYSGHRIPLPQSEDVTKVNLLGVNYMGGFVITL